MEFSHINKEGKAVMVDVTDKEKTKRTAIASGRIIMKPETLQKILSDEIIKGDVLNVSKVAGILGTKSTPHLIPMCHPLLLTGIDITFTPNIEESSIIVEAKVKTYGKTGVEMEALTGVTISLLTMYDMCKAVDKSMVITDVHLVSKSGGKSGDYKYEK